MSLAEMDVFGMKPKTLNKKRLNRASLNELIELTDNKFRYYLEWHLAIFWQIARFLANRPS